MGDRNQYEFVSRRRDLLRGPLLEVGAHDYGSGQDLRRLLPGAEWIGVDLSAGPGVDVVADLTRPFEEVDAALGGRRFGTILCFSVLEHCADPFAMADHLTRLLAPAGRLFVSVPFAWEFHGYPSDYWRFTHEGVRRLFPALGFPPRTPRRARARRPRAPRSTRISARSPSAAAGTGAEGTSAAAWAPTCSRSWDGWARCAG